MDLVSCLDTKGRRRKLRHTIHCQLLLNSAALYSQQSQQPTEDKRQRNNFVCHVEVFVLFTYCRVSVIPTPHLFLPPRKGGKTKQMHSTPQDKSPLPYPS